MKKVFKRPVPVGERGDWESYVRDQPTKHAHRTAQIVNVETALNGVVYPAFDLTPEEIALIETSTKCPDGAVQPLPSIAVVSSRPTPDARLAAVSEIPRIPTRLNAARLKLGVQSITSSLIIGDANKSGDHGRIQPERQTAITAAGARSGIEAG